MTNVHDLCFLCAFPQRFSIFLADYKVISSVSPIVDLCRWPFSSQTSDICLGTIIYRAFVHVNKSFSPRTGVIVKVFIPHWISNQRLIKSIVEGLVRLIQQVEEFIVVVIHVRSNFLLNHPQLLLDFEILLGKAYPLENISCFRL